MRVDPVDAIRYRVGHVHYTRFLDEILHVQAVVALCCHPSQPLIFTGCLDGAVRCWDLRTGMQLRTTVIKSLCASTQFIVGYLFVLLFGNFTRNCDGEHGTACSTICVYRFVFVYLTCRCMHSDQNWQHQGYPKYSIES